MILDGSRSRRTKVLISCGVRDAGSTLLIPSRWKWRNRRLRNQLWLFLEYSFDFCLCFYMCPHFDPSYSTTAEYRYFIMMSLFVLFFFPEIKGTFLKMSVSSKPYKHTLKKINTKGLQGDHCQVQKCSLESTQFKQNKIKCLFHSVCWEQEILYSLLKFSSQIQDLHHLPNVFYLIFLVRYSSSTQHKTTCYLFTYKHTEASCSINI